MVGMISINKVIFSMKLLSLKVAATNLSTKKIDTSDLCYDAQALEKYIEMFEDICGLMTKYEELVLQDVETIKTVGDAYDNMDVRSQLLWEKF